jgi:hypothetical protein
MPLSVLLAVTASQIHNAMLPIQTCFARGLVFTTQDFSMIGDQIGNGGHGNKALRPSKQLIRNRNPTKIFPTGPMLRKLG